MADVFVQVAGREYRLACRDGEEEALRSAARELDLRAQRVQQALGAVTEPRLLLMAGLMMAGEYLEGETTPDAPPRGTGAIDEPRLRSLVARAEALADSLEALVARGLEGPAASA